MKATAGKRWALALSAFALMILCTACSQKESVEQQEEFVIGVVTKSSTSEYWMNVCQGIKDAAEELQMKVLILSPDTEADEEAQNKMAETLLKKDVDVLAVSPINSYETPAYLKLAEEKEIPVITYDTSFKKGKLPYIGIDNKEAGHELASFLAEELDHEGQVGIISGELKQSCHQERVEGFKERLKEEPNMSLAFVKSGYGNQQLTEKEIRSIFEEHPSIKGIMATSAVAALGLADGITDKEKGSVKLVTVDEQSDTLQALDDGKLQGLIAQSGYKIGYETVQYIQKNHSQIKQPNQKIIDAELLTSP